jgi:2,5-furandicarboxylate decarboxylase 1
MVGDSTRTDSQAPIATLRDWISHLAATDRLAIATPGRDLRFEVAAIAKNLDGKKAVLFPRPGNHALPIISGIVSSRGWIAEALGVSMDGMLRVYGQAAAAPIACREVESAPCQEMVHHTIVLEDLLPIPTHNEFDSGPYITAGLLIVRHPHTGRQNVSIHRCQVNGPREIGILLLPRHALAFFDLAEADDAALDVAIVIGVDPLTLLASQAIAPLEVDELEIAGALRGAPLDVVRCKTSDVRVPAEAEIVIEGRLMPRRRAPEGPFGEFPQYYGDRADRHVIEVDCVTHRADAIFHTIIGGGLEHLTLGGIPREATILHHLRLNFPNVRDVHLSLGGVCRYHLHVRIRNTRPGEARNIILAALSSHYDIKQVIVVDEDVDIFRASEVEWAVATRSQADRDHIVIPAAQGSKLDPSTIDGVGAKLGIDATVPLDAPAMKFRRIRVPGEDSVDLDSVIARRNSADWMTAR